MSELKRTQLYNAHIAAGASMVDFGGWEMPVQYPSGIVAEHLYTRHACSLFDVSHMGRLLIEGAERLEFLQHVLTSNVAGLELNKAQYCIIPDEDGSAIDDAYLYRFEEDKLLLVVNAANTDKDKAHLNGIIKNYNCTMTDISREWAAIAVQGPRSKELLMQLSSGEAITEPMKNALNTLQLEGHTVKAAKTGYTGEPLGYEIYIKSGEAEWLWNRLIELGARPAGLGARDTLRLEAALPLYGHEMGLDPSGKPMPIFAVPLAKFAVSFSPQKGEYIGRAALSEQYEAYKRIMNRDFGGNAALPRRIQPITLIDRGVMRAGMEIYKNGRHIVFTDFLDTKCNKLSVEISLWRRRLIPHSINKNSSQTDISGENQRDQRQQHNTGDAQFRLFTQEFIDQHDACHSQCKQQNGCSQRHMFVSFL